MPYLREMVIKNPGITRGKQLKPHGGELESHGIVIQSRYSVIDIKSRGNHGL